MTDLTIMGETAEIVRVMAEDDKTNEDRTIDVYRSPGFHEREVFSELWDPLNPCLIIVKPR